MRKRSRKGERLLALVALEEPSLDDAFGCFSKRMEEPRKAVELGSRIEHAELQEA